MAQVGAARAEESILLDQNTMAQQAAESADASPMERAIAEEQRASFGQWLQKRHMRQYPHHPPLLPPPSSSYFSARSGSICDQDASVYVIVGRSIPHQFPNSTAQVKTRVVVCYLV